MMATRRLNTRSRLALPTSYGGIVHISKLDAAERQLESAIRMFFHHGDPVAVHTLTPATRTLLIDLGRHEGREAALDAMLRREIRADQISEVRAMLVEAQNFFKQADRDPEAMLDFDPKTTEILLREACGRVRSSHGSSDPHPLRIPSLVRTCVSGDPVARGESCCGEVRQDFTRYCSTPGVLRQDASGRRRVLRSC
jgi:hypothetical protein